VWTFLYMSVRNATNSTRRYEVHEDGTKRTSRLAPNSARLFLKMPARLRLDRALSKLRLASRSEAQQLIRDGRVRVADRVVTDPAALVVPEPSRIKVAGQVIADRGWRTIALNKPRGVVTTRRDPEGRKTVFEVLGAAAGSLVAVGRLDLASTGLLLLTTDTPLAAWLTDPLNEVVRRYVVTARGAVTDEAAREMERGIGQLSAKSVTVRKRSKKETHLIVELQEGRNREIRRLLQAVGHEVTRLLRVSFGAIELGTLQPGAWREVERQEIDLAFPATRLSTQRADR
jgi:23S rRNA pseudouridine2605 synthase